MRPIEGNHTAPELDNGSDSTLDEMRKLVINQTLYKNEDGPAPGQKPTIMESGSKAKPTNTNPNSLATSLGGILEQTLEHRGKVMNAKSDEETVQEEIAKEKVITPESLRMTENIMSRLMR